MKYSKEQKFIWGLFIISMMLWFAVFAKYLSGGLAMTQHGRDYYFMIKYYMENLTRGVFPRWDPFTAWGRPDEIDQQFIGAYNPFLWIYPLLTAIHVARPVAFLLYSFIYYQVGIIGFYFLACRFFQDRKTRFPARGPDISLPPQTGSDLPLFLKEETMPAGSRHAFAGIPESRFPLRQSGERRSCLPRG